MRSNAECLLLPAGEPGFDELQDLPYTDAVIRESSRMFPAGAFASREAKQDMNLGGELCEGCHARAFSSPLVQALQTHRAATSFQLAPQAKKIVNLERGLLESLASATLCLACFATRAAVNARIRAMQQSSRGAV